MEGNGVLDEENLLNKVIAKGNIYLRLTGLKMDSKDRNRTFMERLSLRRLLIFIFLCVNMDIIGQTTWLTGSFLGGTDDLFDITFVMPCISFTYMAFAKPYYFIKYSHHIHECIIILNNLNINKRERDKDFEKGRLRFLNNANTIIKWVIILAMTAFGVGPLIRMAATFYNTGEIKLALPFLFSYPFDPFDIRYWPFLYLQQVWSGIVTVFSIWGPDYVGYALATFIIINFFYLKKNIAASIQKPDNNNIFVMNEIYRVKLKEIVTWHNDLIRCAELLEASYTKTILLNVVISSIIICFSLFNITANNNTALMIPFTGCLAIVLIQIFMLCYFGDMLMRSSMEVSDAIYECQWYVADPAVVKDLLIICLRTIKPCKLTAFGYSDVNLKTFTKILSTSWSYFALLQTIYSKKMVDSKL